MDLLKKHYKNWILLSESDSDTICTAYNTNTNELYRSNKSRDDLINEIDKICENEVKLEERPEQLSNSTQKTTCLVIAAAERCNIACKYCFASAGTYGNAEKPVITTDMLDSIWEFAQQINSSEQLAINFFGGEPLLAADQIISFCTELKNRCIQMDRAVPAFSVITNGTLITDGIAEKLASCDVGVCVSVDGPKEIHDSNRIYLNGNGSYSRTMHGVECLKKAKVPFITEATLTLDQIASMSEEEMVRYFEWHGDSGAVSVGIFVDLFVSDIDSNDRKVLHAFLFSMTDYFFRKMSEPEYTGVVFQNVLSICQNVMGELNPYKLECGAGISQMFVTATGDVYPCHQYYASNHGRLGDVFNPEQVESGKREQMTHYYERTPAQCDGCLYSRLCSDKCPGMRLLVNGEENKLNHAVCFMEHTLIDLVLYRLSHFPNAEVASIFRENMLSAIERNDKFVIPK